MKNVSFLFEKVKFLVVKFSIYLNRRVFVMFGEKAAYSACHLFFLWLFNCVCLSFPLMLRTC